ncbi:MAG: hypothetical protein WCX31_20290 [Salinivirgaceae bacterium]
MNAKCIYLFLLLLPVIGFSQNLSNLRYKTWQVTDSIQLDSFYIIPESEIISCNNTVLEPKIHYSINYSTTWFVLKNDSLKGQSLKIVYRVFPFRFSDTLPEGGHPEFNFITSQKPKIATDNYWYDAEKENSESTLEVTGLLSRGMNVGNNQNMVMTSDLNLQIKGKLTDQLFMDAVIADKSIPIQPDGYSQQIKEFDQIYIRLYDSTHYLQMGDVEISPTNSYFLRFNRKILGGDFTAQQVKLGSGKTGRFKASAAVAKGNFNRMTFNGLEGSQGPYPLRGANNETYLVILAGTEKIYIDGMLLQRGENSDYVINYNTGELTFTSKHIITGATRIIAEFEYSDKNYNRFLLYSQNEVSTKNAAYQVSYFAEGDAKDQPVNQELTSFDKQILSNAGDNPLAAVIPSYDSIAYDSKRVLYKITDTLVGGIRYDSILVHSTHTHSAFYGASFSYLGENRGNYIQAISATNGKVYQWVAPINGIPQGSYEPIQLLIAPQKKQMVVAKAVFKPTINTTLETELAFSNKDLNTFSDIGNQNNQGFAFKSSVTQLIPVKQSKVEVKGNYEYRQKDFNPVERYQSAEFERDWNLKTPVYSDAHLLQSTVGFKNPKGANLELSGETLQFPSHYSGLKGGFNGTYSLHKFTAQARISLLNSEADAEQTLFYRHNLTLFRKFGTIKIGGTHQFENNRMQLPTTDSLLVGSQKFSQTDLFMQPSDTAQRAFGLNYRNRSDFLPLTNQLQKASHSDDISLSMKLAANPKNQLSGIVTWRQFQITNDSLLKNIRNDQNLLGRLEHQWNSAKRVLSLNTFYEIGTGMENKKEFYYVEVATGQGIYVWVDHNDNNLPELDEFEISAFPNEANYIKIYTPTRDYVKVYSNIWNETVKIDPSMTWKSSQGFKKMVSLFSILLNYRIQQKQSNPDLWARLNPMPQNDTDTSLQSRSSSFRNTLSFNRNQRVFGADYTFSRQNQKTLLVNGFDNQYIQAHDIKIRWNLTSELLVLVSFSQNQKEYQSEYFSTKNYHINTTENTTTFQWQPSPRVRTSLDYKIKSKKNQWGKESVLLQEFGPELKINSPKQGLITLNMAVIVNNYTGAENSPVAYNMLEGYSPGENYKWSVYITRNLNQFLRLSLNYSGRKPSDLKVIHTGQVSVSAYF